VFNQTGPQNAAHERLHSDFVRRKRLAPQGFPSVRKFSHPPAQGAQLRANSRLLTGSSKTRVFHIAPEQIHPSTKATGVTACASNEWGAKPVK